MLTSIYADTFWFAVLDCLAIGCMVGIVVCTFHLVRDFWRSVR